MNVFTLLCQHLHITMSRRSHYYVNLFTLLCQHAQNGLCKAIDALIRCITYGLMAKNAWAFRGRSGGFPWKEWGLSVERAGAFRGRSGGFSRKEWGISVERAGVCRREGGGWATKVGAWLRRRRRCRQGLRPLASSARGAASAGRGPAAAGG